MKRKTHEEFLEELYEKNQWYREGYFTVQGLYKTVNKRILIKTIYGICFTLPLHLLKGILPTISTAIDKNSFFVAKSVEVHGEVYDYSNVHYMSSKDKVEIVCEEHGKFLQKPEKHWSGQGCPQCGNLKISEKLSKNPSGWRFENWKLTGEKSKNFDSFKVYIIRCWNENEEFYKIGRTFKKVNKRFYCNETMPYNYEIVQIIKGEPMFVHNLETELKNRHKDKKYLPSKDFKGKFECFSKINLELIEKSITFVKNK